MLPSMVEVFFVIEITKVSKMVINLLNNNNLSQTLVLNIF